MTRTNSHPQLPAQSGGIKSEFHILVHDLARMQRTLFDRAFKPLGITRSQWWALKTLAVTGGGKSNQTDLARQLTLGKASLGKLLTNLENNKLLSRNVDPQDQRANNITVLRAGLALLEQAGKIEADLSARIVKGIPENSLKTAHQTLHDAKANIGRKNLGNYPGKLLTSHTIEKMESITGQVDPNRIGFLIHDVSRMRRSVVDRLLQPLGLTRSQWWVLSFLEKCDGLTKSMLASELKLSRSSLDGLLKRLIENKLLRLEKDPEDLRRSRIFLTKAGRSLLRSVRSTTAQAEDFVISNIDQEKLRTSVQTLTSMRSNMTELLHPTS